MFFAGISYIQLEQKCHSELVEDLKKDTFRYFLRQHKLYLTIHYKFYPKNDYAQRV